jgi:hypothetical protein
MLPRTFAITSVAVAALSAGSAHAAFMSFASDSADHAWTFTGNGSTFTSTSLGGNANPILLNIDDNNGPAPDLQFSCAFTSTTTLTFAGDVNVGGVISHNYTASGNYNFTDVATGTTIFTVTYTGMLFTARGSNTSWFTTGALQGDNTGGNVTMTWTGANLPNYGLANNAIYRGGFSFALDSINTSGALPYAGGSSGVNLTNNLPNATWFAESSIVATTIPAPARLSVLGLSALIGARRRRS